MKQRVLIILGMAVGLLVLYTLFFGARPVGSSADLSSAAARLQGVVATEATGSTQAGDAVVPADEEQLPAGSAKKGTDSKTDGEPEQAPIVWGSDPFVREWLMVNELAELNLKAITLGGDKAYVLINDQILEEGDVISGKRIALIESDKVILEQGGRTFTLLLGE